MRPEDSQLAGEAPHITGTGPLFRLLKTPTEPPEAPLGSHASVLVMRASPKYLRYRLLGLAIAMVVAAIAGLGFLIASVVSGDGELAAVGLLLLFVAVFGMTVGGFVMRIDYQLRYYILTDRSLRVRCGALVVREQTLTYANVQNLDLKQGPLQRWFGIADLHVETAGGGSGGGEGKNAGPNLHEAIIAGVENAGEIRELIRARLDSLKDAGLGDPDDRKRAVARGVDSPEALAALRELAAEARGLCSAARASS